jgi:hypothetical protein
MAASDGGHTDICRYLIEKGCIQWRRNDSTYDWSSKLSWKNAVRYTNPLHHGTKNGGSLPSCTSKDGEPSSKKAMGDVGCAVGPARKRQKLRSALVVTTMVLDDGNEDEVGSVMTTAAGSLQLAMPLKTN